MKIGFMDNKNVYLTKPDQAHREHESFTFYYF